MKKDSRFIARHKRLRHIFAAMAAPLGLMTGSVSLASHNTGADKAAQTQIALDVKWCGKPEISSTDQKESFNRFSQAVKTIGHSPTASFLFLTALQDNLAFCLDHRADTPYDFGVYDPEKNHITLNMAVTDKQVIGTITHELRHKWQDLQGVYVSAKDKFMDRLILTGFKEADAQTVSFIVFDELKNHPDTLSFPKEDESGYQKMNDKFYETPDAPLEQKALSAFAAWYDTDIYPIYTARTVKDYLNQIDTRDQHFNTSYDYFTLDLENSFYTLGQLPNGQNYLNTANVNDFIERSKTESVLSYKDMIEKEAHQKKRDFCKKQPYRYRDKCAPFPTRHP